MTQSASQPRQAATRPQSFLECFSYFLTPQVCKQAQQAARCCHGWRWQTQPLIFVLLVMTWCVGDSLPERFETARAFYVALHQRRRRPGKTFEGFQKALTKLPMPVLRAATSAVRGRLAQVFAERLVVDGFIPLGCDGSGLECPRTKELEQRLSRQDDAAPGVWVTAIVHLSLGLLWSWQLGKGTASERHHLLRLLATLPPLAILVADAGYVGYDVLATLLAAGQAFLLRLSSSAPLYAPQRVPMYRFREGIVYYWPQWAQEANQPAIPVRLLRIRGKKVDVWLITNVLEVERLPRQTAGKFYRWRWRNEGLFRSYKRTLQKVKLMSRTVAMVHREMEGSLLAVQVLLAQGALALQSSSRVVIVLPSARKVLLELRREIRNVVGMYLGPRQRQTYWERLLQARWQERKQRSKKVRRRWPRRKDHKQPGLPTILKMGTDLKEKLIKTLGSLCGQCS